jgi:hypothetical protein
MFERSLGEINRNKKRGSKNYCSKKCRYKTLKERMVGKNNPFYNDHRFVGKNHPMYGKKRPDISKRMSGKNNPFYIDGRALKNKLERHSFNSRRLVKDILRRDNFTCLICSKYSGYLEVDHIMPWSFYPKLRYDPENCRTLCKPCHKEYGANPQYNKWAVSPIIQNGN